ncbi:MAG TPA: hypothetical protein VFQ39_03690, partial [Longimicrobium sp.]|nr:hypothetical protein [Longimicrobium sp.]
MSAPAILRTLVLLLLVAAFALPSTWGDARTSSRALWMEGGKMGDAAGALLDADAPPVVARASTDAPGEAELELLGAAAARAPLYVALPNDVALVEADAPARALAGRAAAIPFRVRAKADDSVTVTLADETGALDSVRVRTDGAGLAAGAFRVRPPRAGWREWTVTAAGRRTATGAWVDSAGAPRVLVRAGFPGWESKFV